MGWHISSLLTDTFSVRCLRTWEFSTIMDLIPLIPLNKETRRNSSQIVPGIVESIVLSWNENIKLYLKLLFWGTHICCTGQDTLREYPTRHSTVGGHVTCEHLTKNTFSQIYYLNWNSFETLKLAISNKKIIISIINCWPDTIYKAALNKLYKLITCIQYSIHPGSRHTN